MRRLGSFLMFFIPFLVFFFYFTNQNTHNHSAAETLQHDMTHGYVEIPAGYLLPSVKASVIKDLSGSWLLKVEMDHFTFTPEKAGMSELSYNEGHAHIYINGKKINRLYGEYYHLVSLSKGKNEIIVTLNANNHGALTSKGKPIQSIDTVQVP